MAQWPSTPKGLVKRGCPFPICGLRCVAKIGGLGDPYSEFRKHRLETTQIAPPLRRKNRSKSAILEVFLIFALKIPSSFKRLLHAASRRGHGTPDLPWFSHSLTNMPPYAVQSLGMIGGGSGLASAISDGEAGWMMGVPGGFSFFLRG